MDGPSANDPGPTSLSPLSMNRPATLTLLRHGQSESNRQGRFTGWADVELSDRGRTEAARAGRLLLRNLPPVDRCFTSMLKRATTTAEIVLEAMGRNDLAVEKSWRLNERHYGALQGLRAWTAVRRFGPVAVVRCRRSFRVRPPALDADDPRHPARDPLYAPLSHEALPDGESVADTFDRLLPYWQQRLLPELLAGHHVLVVSHKNTLRALLRLLHRQSPQGLPQIHIRTGTPMVMRFDAGDQWTRQPHTALACTQGPPP
jgi:2,3-bisphosphoglycerate-dependent phosphoglycerate mutase